MTCFKNTDIQLTPLLRLTVEEPLISERLFPSRLLDQILSQKCEHMRVFQCGVYIDIHAQTHLGY